MTPDPRSIDHRDGLNPYLLNQFDPARRPSDFGMLQSELYMGLRYATGYEPRIEVIPDAQNVALAPRGSYESRFLIPHGSFLYAISAASPEAEGFSFQISDIGNGGTLFHTPIRSHLATPAAGLEEEHGGTLHFLRHPRAVLSPGLLSAQIINRSSTANALQLALWFIQPIQEPAPRPAAAGLSGLEPAANPWNAILWAELDRQRAGPRRATSILDPGGNAAYPLPNGAYPWETMPPNGTPLRYDPIATLPAAGTDDYPIISFRVPNGHTAALKQHRHRYLGSGFTEGSGDLIWRIAVDGAHAPGYEDMETSAPEWEDITGAIIATSGQLVEYTVTHPATSALAAADIQCGLKGYIYPQQ